MRNHRVFLAEVGDVEIIEPVESKPVKTRRTKKVDSSERVARELVRMARELTALRSMYDDIVTSTLRKLGRTDIDPRHAEAYLRLDFRTLDHLSRTRFLKEISRIIPIIDADPREAERLARSYGL